MTPDKCNPRGAARPRETSPTTHLDTRGPRYSHYVVEDESPQQRDGESGLLPVVSEQGSGSGGLRERVPAEIRNVSFQVAVRGYDRTAVDAYVKRVNRLIAELEVSRSPQSAVRHALDRLGEQTTGILQQARESAEKLTAGAREEAEESIASARAEAEQIVADARAEASRLRAEAEESIASARAEAEQIVADARAEASRFRTEAEESIASARAEGERILADAKAEASRLRAEAEQTVSSARAEADGLKAEAEQIVASAKVDADEIIDRSDAEAKRSLARACAEAAERLQRSEQEIAASWEQAEARMRELHAETEAVWKERQELLDEIHGIGARLQEVASGAAARFSPRKPGEPALGAEAERSGVAAADEALGAMSMVVAREQSDREASSEEDEAPH
jgi:DivIVA domain-containing protein